MTGRRNSPAEYRVNDQRPYLRLTFKRDDEEEDLGSAVKVEAKGRNVKTPETLKFLHTMVPIDPTNGVFEIQWLAADLDTAGLYEIEFEITWSVGVTETPPQLFYLRIKEQFQSS